MQPSEAGQLTRGAARTLGPRKGLVLFIDQLEEWRTFADPEEAALAARAVFELCNGAPGLRVLATCRSDLLAELSRLPTLGPELSNSLFLLGPVQQEHLRDVIIGPARIRGVHFESEAMVQTLVDFASEGGHLPLLQFALSRLWASRGDRPVMTEAALRKMGGVSGALAQHADGVLARLPSSQGTEARGLLLRLVSVSDKRRRRTDVELLGSPPRADCQAALAMLASERIVMARDSADGSGWEIAHEALLREWPTLQRWLSEDVEARAARERLHAAAQEWQRLGRPPEALWGERQLQGLSRRGLEGESNEAERAFLLASRRRARIRKFLLPSVVGAVVLAGVGTYFVQRWLQAQGILVQVDAHVAEAVVHLHTVDEVRGAWERQRDDAVATFDRGNWPEGERAWEEALAKKETWRRHLGLASVQAEKAFLLDPERRDVRTQLARIVAERLALARLEGRPGEQSAELERLRGIDDERRYLDALDRPGVLNLRIRPEQAAVRLQRVDWRQGLPVLGPDSTPLNRALPPGSYLLTATALGHSELRSPFLLEPGQTVSLDLTLLSVNQVPEGFVHIPQGQFLFGAAGDEKVRREFYEASPLHPLTLRGFLVGRHEVTFAEWMTFLETLSPAEQNRRLPSTQSSIGGTTETAFQRLHRTPRGWRFTFTPISQRYTALAGEPVVYRDRTAHVSQDWRRFPVTAITPSDMEAYVQWLDRTGRVPGARLCTEHEWERAARGADARTFAHGDVFNRDDANLDETYGYRDAAYGPDEVGTHPASRSPFGVDDLLGNAWEVVRSVNAAKRYVVRGGSWHVGQISSRIPNSWVVNPDFRQVDTSFRVCAPAP